MFLIGDNGPIMKKCKSCTWGKTRPKQITSGKQTHTKDKQSIVWQYHTVTCAPFTEW